MNIKRFTPKRIYNGLKTRWLIRTKNYRKLADHLYYMAFGRHINWSSREDLNQWINWLAFNTDTTQWSLLADKYKVRDYIAEKGFADNLVPLLAVWDNPEKINFDSLPKQFVLKINNGSGDVRIIHDKEQVDLEEIKDYFRGLFNHPFGADTAEPHYLRIKPYVIAEELLDVTKQEAPSSSLIDYKFWCFNGVPDRCFICSNRTKEHFTVDLYTADEDWERIENGNLVYDTCHLKAKLPMPKPQCLEDLLKLASELSKGFPQMRVDFYVVDGNIYIGELTLSSACGRMGYFTTKNLTELGRQCKKASQQLHCKFLNIHE